MQKSAHALIFLALAGCASTGPSLSTPITLPRTIPFTATAIVSEAVRNECLLESNLAEHLRTAVASEYRNVLQVERISPATPGRTLSARITRVQISANGILITVDGALRDNGRVVGSFTDQRVRQGLASAAGHCGQLLQLSRLIGQDIAHWAREPRMNALLGTKSD